MQKPIFSNKRIVAENKYWQVTQKDFIDSQERKWNVITMKSTKQWNGSFILALTQDNQIILNKDYKFWPDDFIYTLPSWFIEKWLTAEENILLELKEETWFTTSDKVIYLWKTIQNWYIFGYNQLYMTTGCKKTDEVETHEWEEIETTLVTIKEFEEMLWKNIILDTYSENCYYRAKEKTNNFTQF